jgi:carboxylate-amine ligase
MAVPDAAALHRVFDVPAPCTVGIEEEVMLLDATTLDLLPRAAAVIAAAGGDGVAAELPASQLELTTSPAATAGQAIAALGHARQRLASAARGVGRLAAIGVHPFSRVEGALTDSPRYASVAAEYGRYAHRQLVCALQVHVAIRPGARAVAVYNELRSYLPYLAALAANSPFHGGEDTGLASVRPKIAENLPRQGISPALPSLSALADELLWFSRAGALNDPASWWWELRLHPRYGTVELRVPDAQNGLGDAAGIVGLAQALCVWLADRYDAGELPPPSPTWRIEQNRWAACRDGLDASLADPDTGRTASARDRIAALVQELMPTACQLGCAIELRSVLRRLEGITVPARYRAIAADVGLNGLVEALTTEFLLPLPGIDSPDGGGVAR